MEIIKERTSYPHLKRGPTISFSQWSQMTFLWWYLPKKTKQSLYIKPKNKKWYQIIILIQKYKKNINIEGKQLHYMSKSNLRMTSFKKHDEWRYKKTFLKYDLLLFPICWVSKRVSEWVSWDEELLLVLITSMTAPFNCFVIQAMISFLRLLENSSNSEDIFSEKFFSNLFKTWKNY